MLIITFFKTVTWCRSYVIVVALCFQFHYNAFYMRPSKLPGPKKNAALVAGALNGGLKTTVIPSISSLGLRKVVFIFLRQCLVQG